METVISLVGNRRPANSGYRSGSRDLFSWTQKQGPGPIVPGGSTATELNREQVLSASAVVVGGLAERPAFISSSPGSELDGVLKGPHLVYKGRHFLVYERPGANPISLSQSGSLLGDKSCAGELKPTVAIVQLS